MKPIKEWKKEDLIDFLKTVDKKTWGIIAGSIVGIVIAWTFVIGPAWFDRPSLRREMQGMESQIQQVKTLNEKRPTLEADKRLYEEMIDKAKSCLFKAEESGLLLGQISKLANESRVEVIASKPRGGEVTAFPAPYDLKYQAKGYDFTVQGGYHELGTLMSRIESFNKLLRIQNLWITPAEATPDKHIAEIRLLAIAEAPPAVAEKGKKANAKKKKK